VKRVFIDMDRIGVAIISFPQHTSHSCI